MATSKKLSAVVDERRQRAHNTSSRKQEFPEHDAPPLDAHACAGLLEAAVRITDQHTVDDATALLEPIAAGQGWKSAWGRNYLMTEPPFQAQLRLALEPLILFKPTRPARRHSIARRRNYGPEHIPARIPQSWFDRHFRHLDITGMQPRVFCRAISVRLYQEATGQPASSAPDFFRQHRRHFATGAMFGLNRWLENIKNSDLFGEALAGLIAELEAAEHLVNYQRRRDRMHNWQLTDPEWEAISCSLPPPRLGYEKYTEWEQSAASTYLWCHITQGERQFAPWVAQGGNVEEIHQVLRNLRYAKAHRRHRPLLDILTTLANRMEGAVDANEFDTGRLDVRPFLVAGGS
ncbi:hypothetical protein JCM4814A_02060 [Streptomyces phaeofaciens JCM 4814]|uniref:Uncharacterized protein n=1 Tax=Streptomyces phaeofaciens TaxID=68254 RepID=A0A918HRS1_9ACTN|nr:hypothetical protein GCM10010226_91830 [Streptomyces phaeofaciens]